MIESTDQHSRLDLTLANLDCEKDAARIATRLRTLPGLSDITVAPSTGQLSLRFDPRTVSEDTIKDTLGALGFPPTDGCGCGEACSTTSRVDLPPEQERRLRRQAWWLTAATIAWNLLEGVVAIGSGLLAGSIALVGFGLDSLVEVSSALVITWRLSHRSADPEADERIERRAVRLIALSFFAIALYVVYDSATKLLGISEEPNSSPIGLSITALSLVVMPAIAWAKRHVARGLGSVALKADAGQTQLCTYLSAVVLVGLAANSLCGWWWMDPIAGLVVAGLAIKEGWEAWTSGELCECGD